MSPDDVLTDTALLDRLATVLTPDPAPAAVPSADELAFLAAIVADRFPGAPAVVSATRTVATPNVVVPIERGRTRTQRHARRLVAALGAATILTGASSAAAAVGVVELPRPVRQAQYALGLPWVESPDVTDVRHTLATLARARRTGDTALEHAAAAQLEEQYQELDSDEKHDVVSVIASNDPTELELLPSTPASAPQSSSPDNTTSPSSPPAPQPGSSDTAPAPDAPPDTRPATPDTEPPTSAPPDTQPAPPPPDTEPVTPDTAPPTPAPPDTTPLP